MPLPPRYSRLVDPKDDIQQPLYNLRPSDPYAPSQPPSNEAGYTAPWGYRKENQEYGAPMEIKKKKINDVPFLIIYLLQFIGYAVLSGIVISSWIKEGGFSSGVSSREDASNTSKHIPLDQDTAFLLLFVTAAGLMCSIIYLIIFRVFIKIIIHVTLITSVLFNIGICAYFWITKLYSVAIVFTVIALFSILGYFSYRSRIPFTTILLQITMDIAKHHISVYMIGFAVLIIQALLSVWFIFTTMATHAKYTPGNPACSKGTQCSNATVAGLVIFEVFSFLWTSQVVSNVALATCAGGPYGAWYYYGPRSQGKMPAHPTVSAFIRASTFSLGSIAFGSLIVALIELLRAVLDSFRQNAGSDGLAGACLACCAECFMGCLESMVEYFNRYAYIEIALYGKSYTTAAKDTYRLFKERGVYAIINDSLVSMTLTWGAYIVGLMSSSMGYIYLCLAHPSYNSNGQYTAPVLAFGFLIGLLSSRTLSSSIEAGVSTLYVGFAEDPQVLAERAPRLYAMIQERYPDMSL